MADHRTSSGPRPRWPQTRRSGPGHAGCTRCQPLLRLFIGNTRAVRHAIWRELHAARETGPLIQGEVDVDEISSELGHTSQPIEGDHVQEGEWLALFQLADELGRNGFGGLRSVLETHFENGESLIVGLVLSFLPYELELEGARFSDCERSAIPTEQILWLTEQSEPLEELLSDASHRSKPVSPRVESPESSARVRQGLSYSQRGDYERAAVEFTAVLHNGQARPIVYVHRGDAYRLRGDYDRAVADYAAALRLDPSLVLALVNRGMVQRMLRRPEAAIADYAEAIRLDPRNVIAFNGRGAAHADLNQFDRAVADYTQALRLEPGWPGPIRAEATLTLVLAITISRLPTTVMHCD